MLSRAPRDLIKNHGIDIESQTDLFFTESGLSTISESHIEFAFFRVPTDHEWDSIVIIPHVGIWIRSYVANRSSCSVH